MDPHALLSLPTKQYQFLFIFIIQYGLPHSPRAVEAPPATSPSEKILDILYRDGAVVIKNLLSLASFTEINGEIKPYMDVDYNSGLEVSAKQTKTVCGLAVP